MLVKTIQIRFQNCTKKNGLILHSTNTRFCANYIDNFLILNVTQKNEKHPIPFTNSFFSLNNIKNYDEKLSNINKIIIANQFVFFSLNDYTKYIIIIDTMLFIFENSEKVQNDRKVDLLQNTKRTKAFPYYLL